MEAVIIYDDLDVASRAIARLDNASNGGDRITQWGLKWWRLDALGSEAAAHEALAESVDAHLVVLAMHSQAEIPAMLFRWLESWAAHRRVQDAAIAVFDGASSDALSLTASPELSEFAVREGLSFILDEGRPAARKSSELVRSGISKLPIAPLFMRPGLRTFEENRALSRHRNWGINE